MRGGNVVNDHVASEFVPAGLSDVLNYCRLDIDVGIGVPAVEKKFDEIDASGFFCGSQAVLGK